MDDKKLIHNGIEYDAGILCDSGAIYLKKGDMYYLLSDEKKVIPIDRSKYMNRIYDGSVSQYDIDNYTEYEFYKK